MSGQRIYDQAERLDIIIRKCAGGRARNLALATGIIDSTISKMCSGVKRLTPYYADKICAAYPALNRDFVESGVGLPGEIDIEYTRAKYLSIIAEKDRQIRLLEKQLEIMQKILEEKK